MASNNQHTINTSNIPFIDLINVVPELWFITDHEAIILECNQFAEQILGKPKSQIIGNTIRSIIKPDNIFLFEKMFALACEKITPGEIELTLITPRESEVNVVSNFSLITIPDTQSPIISILLRDITERRRTELQLLRFANAIHYTVNPIEITDNEGKIIYVNPAFEHVTGYRREELFGLNPNVLDSSKHDASFWQNMWEEINSGHVWRGEVINKRKNGEIFYSELLISPIIDPSGKPVGFIGTHLDITEKKKLEQQLIQSQKLESIGTLSAGIAHEVGNPLTSISSLVQLIQRTSTDQNTLEKLELVRNQISRIAKIIRQLVDFSRPSNYETRQINVNSIIQEAVNIVRYSNKAEDVHFVIDLGPDIPNLLLVQDQIIQVFLNILLNALDALNTAPREVRVRSYVLNKNVYMEFEDTGVGISSENLPKIFEPFFTTKSFGEGAGLGLWISYGIIKNFHGDIIVESQEKVGTKFTVILPIPS